MRVLWLTNDLPPRAGGIQQFVGNLLRRVHPTTTVVVGPAAADATSHDARVPWRTVRAPGPVLPTRQLRRLAMATGREHRPDVIVLGAAWPLGELAPALGHQLHAPVVALSHGLEAGLAGAGLGVLVRRATHGLAALTTISDYTERRLRPHVEATRIERVPPGVDVELFDPDRDGSGLRRAWGVPDGAPLVGCISRLVPRKGQDALVAAWPEVRRRHPDAWLAIVGAGPRERALRRAVTRVRGAVLPGPVAWEALPDAHAALDVFAMPCRTRLAGMDVEGLGIVYLEAQASGVPVVAGDSGGAPEAVRDGGTGLVVDGRDRAALVAALDRLLADDDVRTRMGRAGRAWAEQSWSWDAIAARFSSLLAEVASRQSGADP